jgi:hypothetical protein
MGDKNASVFERRAYAKKLVAQETLCARQQLRKTPNAQSERTFLDLTDSL